MNYRKFTPEDQTAFAELSGDYNPLHLDAVAARRLLFGAPVVHGIHVVLWVLDCLMMHIDQMVQLRTIRAIFSKPIKVSDEVNFSIINENEGRYRIEISNDQSVVAIVTIDLEISGLREFTYIKNQFPNEAQQRLLTDNEIEIDSGSLNLFLNLDAATKLFPYLMGRLSHLQVAVILCSTRLVGSLCPGLHSIYSELSLTSTLPNGKSTMDYEVIKLDKRVGLVQMTISSPEMNGSIKAFRRPPPVIQESFNIIKNSVNSNEFDGQRALVIGGSRGLGEVAAKLLSGGGADVKLSYCNGRNDAVRIVDDIVSHGGVADCFYFDVLAPQHELSEILRNGWIPTHLYYFATPTIFSGGKLSFSPQLFTKFCDYYVVGFMKIINALSSLNIKLQRIFYPSTVAIDDLPMDMSEYVSAKIASEMLCNFLEKKNPETLIYKPRLPRMSTDQTVSILPVNNLDPVPFLLNELRSFCNLEPNKSY